MGVPTHRGATARAPGELPRTVWLLGAALAGAWLLMRPHTADLAAATYRAHLFSHEGFALWDNAWFEGHHLPGYSLLYPPLAALAGASVVGAAASVGSTVLFCHLVMRHHAEHARGAAVWFAFGAAGDLFIGRLAYAVGVALGLAAITAWSHQRRVATVVLTAACAAASPVAGVFLAFIGLAAIVELGVPSAARIGGTALATAGLMALLFSEGGTQPYDLAAASAAVVISLGALACVRGSRHTWMPRAVALYTVAVVASYVVPTPMGSNVARLGSLFVGPLLLCAGTAPRRLLVAATCAAVVVWQLWAPVTEVLKTVGNPSTSAAYFQPLVAYLRSPEARLGPGRVEVVPTSTRWESVYVARDVELARGWETQLDRRYDALFYRRSLDPAAYRRWLQDDGVRYVALPDAPLERWGRSEARLLRRPPRWLRPVWHDRHWRVFAVVRPAGMVSGPGRLTGVRASSFTVVATRPGTLMVRVRFTPYWTSTGPGCAGRGPHGWTTVRASRAGVITVRASWTAHGLLGRHACAR